MQVSVARQAILDSYCRLYGYELLFRAGPGLTSCTGTDDSGATKHVIANGLMSIGLETLVGRGHAFVNFGRDFLLEGWHEELPASQAIIEVLETVQPDEDIIQACRKIRDDGYTIALDDFVLRPGWEPLVDLANLVKIEINSLPRKDHEAIVRYFHHRGLHVVAEKVETYEEFQWAREAGYDYYQGYFFAKPVTLTARAIPAAHLNCVRLLKESQKPELDIPKLERHISGDVSLSYKLLRYVNSALFARSTHIQSIRHALLYFSEANLRRWISLAVLQQVGDRKPEELILHSLVRARMSELLAQVTGKQDPSKAFLTGLFSLLDALTDRSLPQALREINLDDSIVQVLTSTAHNDAAGASYEMIRAYEAADWDTVDRLSEVMGLPSEQVAQVYGDALSWVDGIAHEA